MIGLDQLLDPWLVLFAEGDDIDPAPGIASLAALRAASTV